MLYVHLYVRITIIFISSSSIRALLLSDIQLPGIIGSGGTFSLLTTPQEKWMSMLTKHEIHIHIQGVYKLYILQCIGIEECLNFVDVTDSGNMTQYMSYWARQKPKRSNNRQTAIGLATVKFKIWISGYFHIFHQRLKSSPRHCLKSSRVPIFPSIFMPRLQVPTWLCCFLSWQ